MIERFFKKIVKTKRLVRNPANNTETWEDHLDNVKCHIQTWAGGTTGYEGAEFPTNQMWCLIGTDVIAGDRVIDGNKIYQVLGVEELDYGKNRHLSLILSVIE